MYLKQTDAQQLNSWTLEFFKWTQKHQLTDEDQINRWYYRLEELYLVLGHIVSGNIVLGHNVLGHIVSGHIVSGHIVSGHNVSGHIVSGHIFSDKMFWGIFSRDIMSSQSPDFFVHLRLTPPPLWTYTKCGFGILSGKVVYISNYGGFPYKVGAKIWVLKTWSLPSSVQLASPTAVSVDSSWKTKVEIELR